MSANVDRGQRVHRWLLAAALLTLLAGCGGNGEGPEPSPTPVLEVTLTDTTCTMTAHEAPAGEVVFRVKNDATGFGSFAIYRDVSEALVADLDKLDPGFRKDLDVTLDAGDYYTECTSDAAPAATREPFTVTGGVTSVSASSLPDLAAVAVTRYQDYLDAEAAQLLGATKDFAEAYASGIDATATETYAPSRLHLKRMEPAIAGLPDLLARLDALETQVPPGETWTGWHVAEQDLWSDPEVVTPLPLGGRVDLAEDLVATTEELQVELATLRLPPSAIAGVAQDLVAGAGEAALTGELEPYSHTDLWDIQAMLEGAHEATQAVTPLADPSHPGLAVRLEEYFTAAFSVLARYGDTTDGFQSFDTLTPAERAELAAVIGSLTDPVDLLAAIVNAP